MTSTNFQVGFTENAKNSSNGATTSTRVLKPPGGGTSDIFGGEGGAETPRTVKNRMASNIFGEGHSTVTKNGERPRAVIDSHNRLFGEPERMQTPLKNRMKSNIPIGDTVDKPQNGQTNGHHSGASSPKMNGHTVNGGGSIKENGVEHHNGTKEGNPVTGEGYKPAGTEINTSIPCLNGANQVINKNRVPPGGFSSGLW